MQKRFGETDLVALFEPWEPDTFYRRLSSALDDQEIAGIDRRGPVSSLAWAARVKGLSPPVPTAQDGLDAAIFYGQLLRYDFRFRDLLDVMNDVRSEFPADDLLHALWILAVSGEDGLPVHGKVEIALSASTANRQTRQVLMHALWFSDHASDAERLVGLVEECEARGENDSNCYFRLASANRKLRRFDAALAAVDRAIDLLAPGETVVHQDYVRERELIAASKSLHDALEHGLAQLALLENGVLREIADTQTSLESRLAQAETVARDSLLRIMEILGLFLALSGFLFGTATAVKTSDTYWKMIIAVSALFVGALGFSLLMRAVAGRPFGNRRDGRYENERSAGPSIST